MVAVHVLGFLAFDGNTADIALSRGICLTGRREPVMTLSPTMTVF